MKILLYSNNKKDNDYLKTKELANYLLEKNVNIIVDENMYDSFKDMNVSCFDEEISDTIDILLVLGGDGTFLSAAHKYYKYHIPYLGLNSGRVGYLSEENMENSIKIIDKVLDNRYQVETKSLLSVKIVSDQGYQKRIAFNEAIIHRGQCMKMLKVDMKIRDQIMDHFYADGVLVATTMGSSAYNLSTGGPLLLDNVNCFVISSICSQSGIMPSIVFNADDHVEISAVAPETGKFVVNIDGNEQIEVNNGTQIYVKKSSEILQVVTTYKEKKNINLITKVFNGYIK